jgi:sec-independent protein translocase protein TatB
VEIFGIGLPEVLLIIVVLLVFVGPERLPEAARTIGKTVGDFRRAIEPARGAWRDLTSEITNVGNEVTTTVRTVGTTASVSTNGARAAIKPSRPGEVVTAVPTENPWSVHPIMKNMTEEERATFMANGTVPPHISEELHVLESGETDHVPYSPHIVDLDYPMPHQSSDNADNSGTLQPIEDLNYPEPRHTGPGQSPAGVDL